jgi:hypothetical protein
MRRRVEPELLDHLPADDPAAIASRRDLDRINWIMGQHRMIAQELRRLGPITQITDLGGGDGRFLARLARRLPMPCEALIADQKDILGTGTKTALAAQGWRTRTLQGDIFETLPMIAPGAVIIANLFLHHFPDHALATLFALIATRARAFIACEPRRSPFALLGAHGVVFLGANPVTRHDAVASVRAGFTGSELTALWPSGWTCREEGRFAFSHLFVAVR